ncbi:MAG: MFS transporter [Caulobacterales bacterium]|nr:MFS transporter [Caulobacterales bacterium]
MLNLPLVALLPAFYAENVGLGLAATGAVFMFARLWDGVTDPVIGALIDRVGLRWGRRKPWMILALPIMIVAALFLFIPPQGASPVYLAVSLFSLYLGYTLYIIAHRAWAAEMSEAYHERSRIAAWLDGIYFIGFLASLAAPIFAVGAAADGSDPLVVAMRWLGLVVIIGMPLTTAPLLFLVKEPVVASRPQSVGLGAYAELLKIGALRRVLVFDLMGGFAIGVVSSLTIFFADRRLGLGDLSETVIVGVGVGSLAGVPFWAFVSRRIGKGGALQGTALAAALGSALLFVTPAGELAFAMLVFAIIGLGGGGWQMLLKSVLADVADVDEHENGEKRIASMYALLTFTNKAGLAMAVGVVFPVLAMLGFDPTQADSPTTPLVWVITVAPIACLIVAWFAMRRYPLTQAQHAAIQADLTAARATKATATKA